MKTMINGKPSEWSAEIQAKWDAIERPEGMVNSVNYFAPRPYVDEYNRGDLKEGFTYTLWPADGGDPRVIVVCINGYHPLLVREPPQPRA